MMQKEEMKKQTTNSNGLFSNEIFMMGLLIICGLILLPISTYAQKEESTSRGLQAGASYSISDIESVNNTNGNVMLNIPLASLPAGRGGLSYGVNLSYNSKMFDTLTEPFYITPPGSNQSATILQPSENGGWHYGYKYKFEQKVRPGVSTGSPPPDDACSAPATPVYKYYDIYKFVLTIPDGGSHEFTPTKYWAPVTTSNQDNYYPISINGEHRKFRDIYDSEGAWFGCEVLMGQVSGTMRFHSTDGSGLRLEVVTDNDNDPTNNFWTLKYPNGMKVTQNEPLSGGGIANQRIYDANGNYVKIDETLNQQGQMTSVTATDELNRSISITKGTGTNPDTITSTGFNGATLTWSVSWKSIGVKRDYKLDTVEWKDEFDPATIGQAFVLIDEIILPTQVGTNQKYEFEYNGNANGDVSVYSNGFAEITQAKLPSGAYADYTYELDGMSSTVSSWQTVKHNPIETKTLTYNTKYDGVSQTVTEKWLYDINRAGSTITSPDGSIATASYSDPYDGGDGIVKTTGNLNSTTTKEFYRVSVFNDKYIFKNIVKKEYTTIKDANGNPSLTAIKEFAYDNNHNLLRVTEYDWVDYSSLSYTNENGVNVLVIPTGAVIKRVTKNEYYNATSEIQTGQPANGNEFYEVGSPDLLSLIKSSEIQKGNGNPVSRTEFIYDNSITNPTKGNLTETRVWDSTKQATLGSADTNGFKLNTSNSINTTTAYDTYGNRILSTDAKGVQSQITYGAVNGYSGLYPTQSKSALGLTEERTSTAVYDFNTGLVISSTDVDNNVTSATEYDDLGRATKVKSAVGTPNEIWSQIEYDNVNRRVITKSDLEVKGDGKKVSIQHYDEMGRVRLARTLEDSATEDPYNETHGIKVQSRYQYDNSTDPANSDGVYTLSSNPYRAATSAGATNEDTMGWSVGYSDKTGRSSTSENFSGVSLPAPWGSNSASTGKSITQTDADATTITDAAGRQKRSITNSLGQLIRIDEPNNAGILGSKTSPVQATYYEYNTLGNMTQVTQGIQKRHFLYDSLGRLNRVRQPEQEINTTLNKSDSETTNTQWTAGFTFDANGNVLTATDAENNTITSTYDSINRPLTQTYSDGITPQVTYTYDDSSVPYSKGQLTKVENSVSITKTTEFDIMGRPKVNQQITDGTTYQMKYKYNLSGQLIEEEYPSGRKVKNDIDADGDIAEIYGSSTPTAVEKTYANNFSYTVDGKIRELRIGNGRWKAAKFNSILQTTEIALGASQGNGSLWKINYEYGELNANGTVDTTKNTGNVAKQTIDFDGLTNTFEQTYKYDSLYRITEAKETSNSQQTWIQTYGYDKYGNRTAFSQNVLGQSLPINNITLPTVDANTNRFNSGQGYDYDKIGNLKKDVTGAESRDTTFDGNNKQIEIKDMATGYKIGEYFYDGSGMRVKKRLFDANGVAKEDIIFVYSGEKLVAEYSTLPPPSNPTTKYVATDTLGSVRAITDQTGQVISRRDFMPFGEELQSDTTYRKPNFNYNSDDVRQKFTGYQKDEETSLDFAEARMYNNKHARFTAVDPLLASGKSNDPQSWNRYAYVGNNPLAFVDPDGRLKRKKNGKIDFKKEGKAIWVGHKGADPNKRYKVQPGYVLADDGKTKIRVFKSLNVVGDVVRDKKGKIKLKKNGQPKVKNKKKDKNKTFECDCHGLTFADGDYWINNSEVDKILTGDGYQQRTAKSGPQVGDAAIYRDADGIVVHSATVTSVENGVVVTVSGIGGIRNSSETTAPDEQFGNITPEYHYDPDDTRNEEQKKKNLERVKSYEKVD